MNKIIQAILDFFNKPSVKKMLGKILNAILDILFDFLKNEVGVSKNGTSSANE